MEIAEHYADYPIPTLLVLTNHQEAKVYWAHDREIKLEFELHAGDHGYDDSRERITFYKDLNKKLEEHLKGDIERLVICAPGAFKEDLESVLSAPVLEKAGELIPKNLVSLEPDQIVRILSEGQVDS